MDAGLMLIIMIGLVDLCADVTYEGGRSMIGQFLGFLGATGSNITIIMGVSEFLGYVARLFSGIIADRTRKYRVLIFIGYLLNMIALPLLSVSYSLPIATCLIMLERCGRAVRIPARDVLVSYAAQSTGIGFGMGLREFFDQLGAIIGPLYIALMWYVSHDYRMSFAMLAMSALLTMILLYKALSSRMAHEFEHRSHEYASLHTAQFTSAWWWFLGAVVSLGCATIDFQLLAYHMQHRGVMDAGMLAILYGCGMAITAVGALVLGKLFDRFGPYSMIVVLVLVVGYSPLILFGNVMSCIAGMVLWSILYACHGSFLAALVARLVALDARATAYGISGAALGVGWLVGSLLRGFLYERSLIGVAILSLIFHGSSIVLFLKSFSQYEGRSR